MRFTLEVVSEDPQDADSAIVDVMRRDTTDALRKSGYSIESLPTGRRDSTFLVNVLIPILSSVWANKETILADGSALVTLFTPVVLIAQHFRDAYRKQAEKGTPAEQPIKIAVEIDGARIAIEAPDLEAAEGAIKLARRFQTQHSAIAAKVTPKSKVKVIGSVPKRHSRRRR